MECMLTLAIFSHMSMFACRWWAGEWEACSATCGPHGEKKRTVLCIQTMGSDEQALPPTDCQHLLKPKTLLSCNRDILCPSDWTVGNWSEVSSGLRGETGIIQASSASAFLLIIQSKVTLGKIAKYPWPAHFPFIRDLALTCSMVSLLPDRGEVDSAPPLSPTTGSQ